MATRITFNFGDDGSEEVVVKHWDDLARALHASLEKDRDITPPKAADFWELASNIRMVSRIIQGLEVWRELAIVAADKTGDDADRNAIAIAAGLPASRLYRILDRHGRPRDRKGSSQRAILEQTIEKEGGNWTPARTVEVLAAAGHIVTPKRARQLLRDIADSGLIAKADPERAVYRITEP
ncbi:hypothetical protein ACIRL2_42550 [Embleya sp. NPDC127516]|uniref:hypothetical protein n=1 Tax=Embleya sp. NPDC127516 TaxID=3363990 RepID=UPI0037F60322